MTGEIQLIVPGCQGDFGGDLKGAVENRQAVLGGDSRAHQLDAQGPLFAQAVGGGGHQVQSPEGGQLDCSQVQIFVAFCAQDLIEGPAKSTLGEDRHVPTGGDGRGGEPTVGVHGQLNEHSVLGPVQQEQFAGGWLTGRQENPSKDARYRVLVLVQLKVLHAPIPQVQGLGPDGERLGGLGVEKGDRGKQSLAGPGGLPSAMDS